MKNHKYTKYRHFFDNPLLRNNQKFITLVVSNIWTYGTEGQEFIKTFAKNTSNINNI